jgi:hypothetical protein
MTLKLILMGFLCGAAIAAIDRWVTPLSDRAVLGFVAVLFVGVAYVLYTEDDSEEENDGDSAS